MRGAVVKAPWLKALIALHALAFAHLSFAQEQQSTVLRVCADPNNMPLSNERGEGYENRIAAALAQDLGRQVEYTWFPQRMGFVRNTLRQRDPQTRQFKCDVIIGVPKGYELTATTEPYMRSTYALIFPRRAEFETLRVADDLLQLPMQTLQSLRIGVFGFSPGADWLLRNGLFEKAAVYSPQSGDPAENPAHIIEQDLIAKRIDMAIVWGPIAGFLIRERASDQPLHAVPFMPDPKIRFDYEISMGVRFGEKQWKATLDQWIAAHGPQLQEILSSYRVPLLDPNGKLVSGFALEQRARDSAYVSTDPLASDSD